ncbi:1-acyl-sn-glycerol-3-phosphate acyltransferase [Limibaculum sp. M0105]|uniref:1-acyl-sn-glycerol-3-phosphate acyltransferase n=1 Tax=Thermohalobaculum xanthum TaxID=2753746 RepID=A0A8J7M9W5_9RHOB|nr:lysophospholipid acyltransferase family protein [Thermohalobaculum xanthum]MBK0400868.1 1-acyl-sn-glycerol-3-phosphate acyltransferase [Thermohalobaculum xanthum]
MGSLTSAARTRLFEVAILLWSLPFGLVILTVFQLWRPPVVVRRALRLWSSGFIAAARWIVGVRYVVEGSENIPNVPAIFVCNHQSYWESIALTALIPDINVISKAEAQRIPVFGWGLKHAPMIFVHRERRGTNLRRVLREAKATLLEGRSVLIFPEGTRVQPGGRRTFQRGLEALYHSAGAPVVPIVHNAGLLWFDGFRTKKQGVVTLRYCSPIAPGRNPAVAMQELERFMNVEKDRLVAADRRCD